jgi:hyperosmotically inducible periplasmic protein
MQAKRSYSGVLAAAAAAAFSLQANVATAAATAVNDSDQASDDAAITARVRDALAADPQLLARGIEVSVRQGVVRLVGFVKSEQDLRLAELDAKSVPGVSKVDNEIELKTAPKPQSH